MNKALGYEVGKTYYNGYWGARHYIREIREHWLAPEIVSEWEDGYITIHSTPFDKKRDKLICVHEGEHKRGICLECGEDV